MPQEIMQSNNQQAPEWVAIPDAAKLAGIGKSSFYKALQSHPQIREKYCRILKGNGRKPILHISKEGMVVLLNTKDTARNIPRERIGALNAPIQTKQAKMEIAEKAIEASQDPIMVQLQAMMVMRREMLGMQENLDEVRHAIGLQAPRIENHEERIGTLESNFDPISELMNESQRAYLNSRVREYVHCMNYEHSAVWRELHDFVGRRSINTYTMRDYSVAIGILKSRFRTAGLSWGA